MTEAAGEGGGDGDWDEWGMGDWVVCIWVDTERAGTGALAEAGFEGVGGGIGAKAEAAAAEAVAGAEAEAAAAVAVAGAEADTNTLGHIDISCHAVHSIKNF